MTDSTSLARTQSWGKERWDVDLTSSCWLYLGLTDSITSLLILTVARWVPCCVQQKYTGSLLSKHLGAKGKEMTTGDSKHKNARGMEKWGWHRR